MRRDCQKFANWAGYVLRGSQVFCRRALCWLGGAAGQLVVQPESNQVRNCVSRLLESLFLGLFEESRPFSVQVLDAFDCDFSATRITPLLFVRFRTTRTWRWKGSKEIGAQLVVSQPALVVLGTPVFDIGIVRISRRLSATKICLFLDGLAEVLSLRAQ